MCMGRASSPSSRSERKTNNFWCPSAIPAWDCPRNRRTRSSMRSSPLNVTARAWDCASAAPSSNRIAAACGQPTTLRAAQAFTSHCPPKSRSMNCRELDWLVQLRSRGAFGVDRHVCVVRCSRSCRSRNCRERLDSRDLAAGRGRCEWDWHLVHALHWDAGVHPADSSGLPLADRSAVAVCGHSRFGGWTGRGEPAEMGWFRALAGSVVMGAGIASMHYIGMAAMRLPAVCHFSSFLVVLSVVFAVLISLAALWITFHFRDEKTGIGWEKLAGASVMGAAIPVMHYTSMAAASFTPSGMPVDLSHAVS